MKILSVMVQLEVPCPECGEPMTRLGSAKVTPDGRIGTPTRIGSAPIEPCARCLNAASAAERKSARLRRRFLLGKARR